MREADTWETSRYADGESYKGGCHLIRTHKKMSTLQWKRHIFAKYLYRLNIYKMKISNVLYVILLLTGAIGVARADAYDDFFSEESKGNPLGRLQHYSPSGKAWVCADDKTSVGGDVPFDLDVDGFFLIKGFRITERTPKYIAVNYDVVGEFFYPCAATIIDGTQRQTRTKKMNETVRYDIGSSNGTWVFIDPPKPFVLCDAYLEFASNDVELGSEIYGMTGTSLVSV